MNNPTTPLDLEPGFEPLNHRLEIPVTATMKEALCARAQARKMRLDQLVRRLLAMGLGEQLPPRRPPAPAQSRCRAAVKAPSAEGQALAALIDEMPEPWRSVALETAWAAVAALNLRVQNGRPPGYIGTSFTNRR